MRSVQVLAALAGLAAVGQLGLIGWASLTGGDVVSALVAMAGVPWELVTLTDLGVGLVVVALWMALLERSLWRVLPWWLGLCLLGNLATAVYLVWRCLTHRSIRSAILDHPESL